MPSNQRGSTFIVFFVLILLALVGGTAYYLGTQKNPPQLPQNSYQPSAIPSPSTVAQASSTAEISQIPSTWTYRKSTACDVSIPVPPKAEPYTTTRFTGVAAVDNNRYWKFTEDSDSSYFFFKDDASVFFYPVSFDGLSNDYNPGSITVFCAPNLENLTSNEVLTKLEKEIVSSGMPYKLLIRDSINKWGFKVNVVGTEGGMHDEEDEYVFSANGRMYYVSFVGSSNPRIKETANEILDNLKFSN